MNDYLPYGRQSIDDQEIRAARNVLESDWLTQGPQVQAFEKELAKTCGARHAVAVSSGSVALYLAFRAAGLGPGDRFVTTPLTFVATANAGVMCGAEPVFVDVDPADFTMDPGALKSLLKNDRTIKAVVPVHLGGRVSNLAAIKQVIGKRDVVIIEDACHAIGGSYKDEDGAWHTVGDGAFSGMTCFSFHPVKTMTTGEGGAIVTNDGALAARMRLLGGHGITRDPKQMEADPGPWYYEMHELGINARMNDIQAAIGRVQLHKLDRLCKRRLQLVQHYDRAFAGFEQLTTQARPANDRSGWHLMIVACDRRAELQMHLIDRNIATQVHYIPVHLQPYYRQKFGTGPGDCPVAEAYYERALSLPLFPDMTDEDIERVVAAVREFYSMKEG